MKRVHNLHEHSFLEIRKKPKRGRLWPHLTHEHCRSSASMSAPTQNDHKAIAFTSALPYPDGFNSKSETAMSENYKFELMLTENMLTRLDAWIASRPETRPSRIEALLHLIDIALIHSNEVEYLQAHVAQADKDIREHFDRVLGMINHVVQGVPQPTARKLN